MRLALLPCLLIAAAPVAAQQPGDVVNALQSSLQDSGALGASRGSEAYELRSGAWSGGGSYLRDRRDRPRRNRAKPAPKPDAAPAAAPDAVR